MDIFSRLCKFNCVITHISIYDREPALASLVIKHATIFFFYLTQPYRGEPLNRSWYTARYKRSEFVQRGRSWRFRARQGDEKRNGDRKGRGRSRMSRESLFVGLVAHRVTEITRRHIMNTDPPMVTGYRIDRTRPGQRTASGKEKRREGRRGRRR